MAILKRIQNYPPYLCNKIPLAGITKYYGKWHTGVDSVSLIGGMDVCAIIDGKVTKKYWSNELGNCVEYGSGDVVIRYYHLGKIYVNVGQAVTKTSTKIGMMGSTGSVCDGLHLHISIYINGKLVDPLPYLTGAKTLPVMKQSQINNALSGANEGEKYMIRKVIDPLNLRSTRSLTGSNLVYKNMPTGTVFLVTEAKTEDGITWGHVVATIGGKTYAGWSNIAAKWSVEV